MAVSGHVKTIEQPNDGTKKRFNDTVHMTMSQDMLKPYNNPMTSPRKRFNDIINGYGYVHVIILDNHKHYILKNVLQFKQKDTVPF